MWNDPYQLYVAQSLIHLHRGGHSHLGQVHREIYAKALQRKFVLIILS